MVPRMPAHRDANQYRKQSRCDPPPAPPEGTSNRLPLRGCNKRTVYRRQQPIAAASHGLDETWILGRVAEGFTQPADGCIQTMVEIHIGIGWPQTSAKFFPGHDFSGTVEQHAQNLKRLFLQTDSGSVAT